MLPEQFMNKRREKTFTATEIMYFLHQQGYCFRLVDTLIPSEGCIKKDKTRKGVTYTCICWPPKYKGSYCADLRNHMENLGIPKHFAYIKFYIAHGHKEGADDIANYIRALVVGKTNQTTMDFEFAALEALEGKPRDKGWDSDLEPQGDKSKKWIHHKNVRWYHEKVLIFWSPKAEGVQDENKVKSLAESVERDIGGLFGLFSS